MRSHFSHWDVGFVSAPHALRYRKEIDGLRAIAVLPVLLFHAGFDLFGGGFVGVDIFFVISGYLITSLILGDLEKGRFSLLSFYDRRARRILPALLFVMLCCLPFAWLWMFPGQFEEFAGSLMAANLFVSNLFFWQQSNYFAIAAELKPLLHTWSLAVEEQYYLCFPLMMMFLWPRKAAREQIAGTITLKNQALRIIIVLTAMSFLMADYGWRHYPEANFFLAPTRFWELLMGALCAFYAFNRTLKSNDLLGFTGLAMIIYSVCIFTSTTPSPSFLTLWPVGGTVLIILFCQQGSLLGKLLSFPPIVGLGLISYSAYLWHQPIFAFARLRGLSEPSAAMMLGLIVLSLVLAYLSWRVVEQPFRQKKSVQRCV